MNEEYKYIYSILTMIMNKYIWCKYYETKNEKDIKNEIPFIMGYTLEKC